MEFNDSDLIVADLFCGGGGTSQALKEACEELGIGYKLYAVNHWRTAIDTHEENHPEAKHACASVGAVDPLEFVPEGRLDLLMASPECIFYSSARGGKPINDQRRSTAWDVVDVWMPALRPKQLLIENVPEFENWGDLFPETYHIAKLRGRPNPAHKGRIFKQYIDKIRALGYTVEYRKQVAADFGAATTRKRLFIMASRNDVSQRIVWPEPTHSKDGVGPKKWRAAREIIDWSLKGESIFNRKRPLAPATMRRILVGLERHGGDALKPYLVALRNHMDGKPIDGPVPTVSAGGTHIGLAEPFIMPVTHGSDISKRERPVSEPLPTITGANRGELGVVESSVILANNNNNVPRSTEEPVATITSGGRLAKIDAFTLSQQSGGVARDVDDPLMTVAAKGAIGLVEFIVPPRHMNEGYVDSIDRPLRTVTATTGHTFGKVDACLVPFYNERPGQAPRSHSLEEPAPTVPATGDGKFGLVEGVLLSAGGPEVSAFPVDKPHNTVLTRDHMALAEPVLVSVAHGDNPPGGPRGNGGRARDISTPMPSVTASGRDYGLAEPVLVEYHSEKSAGDNRTRTLDDPLPTQTTENRFGVAEPCITSYYGTLNVSSVKTPLPTVTAKSRFGMAMPVINGKTLDIRFRMLQPHELAGAMDFPKGYKFVGKKKRGGGVNKGDQVRMIGNAVDVRHGKALIKTRIHAILAQHRVAA